jgi:hypothetical protein
MTIHRVNGKSGKDKKTGRDGMSDELVTRFITSHKVALSLDGSVACMTSTKNEKSSMASIVHIKHIPLD